MAQETIPERALGKYTRTNRDVFTSLINMPALERTRQLPFETKKTRYCDRLVPGNTEDKSDRSKHKDNALAPTFYNIMQEGSQRKSDEQFNHERKRAGNRAASLRCCGRAPRSGSSIKSLSAAWHLGQEWRRLD